MASDDLRWAPDNRQIYFIAHQPGKPGNRNVWSFTVADGAVRQLTNISDRTGRLGRDLATDGSYFYFTWREHSGDIWVMGVEQD